MTVERVMTKNPVVIHPELSVNDARAIMRREHIGRLPVLDKNNRLAGIITELDVINASPSAATTLDIYEMNYLLSKLKVEKIMEKNVVAVEEDTIVETAARIMADNHISGLPVLKNGVLTGIVTEGDLFRLFIDLFGARSFGVRISMYVEEKPGVLARIAGVIADLNGNIITCAACPGENVSNRLCVVKVSGVPKDKLLEAIKPYALEITDAQEI